MLKAVKGEQGIVEPTFVYLPGIDGGDAIAKATGVDFFSVPVELGVSPFPVPRLLFPLFFFPPILPFPLSLLYSYNTSAVSLLTSRLMNKKPNGAVKAHNILESANEHEKKLLETCQQGLKGNVDKGIEFAQNPPPAK